MTARSKRKPTDRYPWAFYLHSHITIAKLALMWNKSQVHSLTKSDRPWNDWYHITIHTYGSWLRGDPRGWRSRHHREQVDSDYKNPPSPGSYDALFHLSQALMNRDPVKIAKHLRQFIADEFAARLQQDDIEVLIVSVDGSHVHILARFRDHNPRHWIGRAKKHASHAIRQQGLRIEEGGLWAKRSHAQPITSRAHQLKTFT